MVLEESESYHPKDTCMLYYAAVFLVIALVAGLFGFGFVASPTAAIAKILFFVFLALFIGSLLTGSGRKR